MAYMQDGLKGVVEGLKQASQALQSQSHDSQMVASAITELTAQAVAEHAEQAADFVNDAEQQGDAADKLTAQAANEIALLEQQIDSAGNNIQVLDEEALLTF